MNLANKTFKNNKTGETIKVIDSFENIAILENRTKMDVSKLLNSELYTEQIDVNNFFNIQDSYSSLADKIKNISLENIKEDEIPINLNDKDNEYTPLINESAIIMSNEDDEIAELARKYNVNFDKNALSKQNEAFNKLLGEDESIQTIEVNRNEIHDSPLSNNLSNKSQEQPIINTNSIEESKDPIITIFKNVKRVKDFSITINIENKIPRLDFIEMMEDSYNVSIIDYLSTEFTNNLLKNPKIIEDMIREKIKEIVYKKNDKEPKPSVKRKIEVNESEKKNVKKSKDTSTNTQSKK